MEVKALEQRQVAHHHGVVDLEWRQLHEIFDAQKTHGLKNVRIQGDPNEAY